MNNDAEMMARGAAFRCKVAIEGPYGGVGHTLLAAFSCVMLVSTSRLNGHCEDAVKTRAFCFSAHDARWQVDRESLTP